MLFLKVWDSYYSYPKSKLVESGLYKYKWHDCYDGNITLELISNEPDYYFPPEFPDVDLKKKLERAVSQT